MFVAVDAIFRAILLLRLEEKIKARGDYRKREHKIGKGKKHFAITLLGASSIYGEGSDVEIPFIGSLVEQLTQQGYQVSVHNLAVSGHRVADVSRQQIQRMKPSDLVVLYAGTKDCLTLTSARQYLADLRGLTEALRGQTVVWVTIGDPRLLWLFPIWLRWLFYYKAKTFTVLLKRVLAKCSTEQWRVVDFFAEGITESKLRNLTSRQVVADGIHLSDKGQALVGEMVSDAAQSLLRSVD